MSSRINRSRWAALGAAVAVTLGAGGVSWVGATISSGSKAVFVPITPCRLADTRKATPLTAAQIKTFAVRGTNGECTIPAGASAISGNITITDPTDDGFLTVAPAGGVGNSSNLNWLRGQSPTPNAFTVALSAGGAIDVRNDRGTVNVIIDINGYYEDHNHDDRYYTKAQTDAAFVPQGEIVISHGPLLHPNSGCPPSAIQNFFQMTRVTGGNGCVQVELEGPSRLGATAYGLKSLEYCFRARVAPAFIQQTNVYASEPAFVGVTDPTDRTADGCYTMTVNNASKSFVFSIELGGGGGQIEFTSLTSTWAPTLLLGAAAEDDVTEPSGAGTGG